MFFYVRAPSLILFHAQATGCPQNLPFPHPQSDTESVASQTTVLEKDIEVVEAQLRVLADRRAVVVGEGRAPLLQSVPECTVPREPERVCTLTCVALHLGSARLRAHGSHAVPKGCSSDVTGSHGGGADAAQAPVPFGPSGVVREEGGE